jgi:post-segregation antitoxin (ccd killing protein)
VKKPWPHSIRESAYQRDAPRQTVSLTINSDLFSRVKAAGINASRVAEDALAAELEKVRRADIEAEVRSALSAIDAYEAKHGSFPERMRELHGTWPGPEGE